MNTLPQIADIFTLPALLRTGDGLLLGVKLENGRVHWGPPISAEITPNLPKIIPILTGHALDDVQHLVARIDQFQEEVTVTRIIQPDPITSASTGTISRRKLISGFIAEDKPQAKEVQVVEKRPFPAPLRFAVSQTLLKAAAAESNQSLVALLVGLFGLTLSREKIPLHVEANETNIAIVRSILSTEIASFGYSTGFTNHKGMLGTNAERLQAHARQVKAWLSSAAPTAKPVVHLNIQGGFTAMYDNNEGKMLGALYGLEQAVKPYPLVIENVTTGDETAVVKTLSTLQSYLKIRRMSVQLAAGNDLFSPKTLQQLVEKEVVDLVQIDLAQFGSIPRIMAFIQACHAHNRRVIVACGEDGVETAVAIALATQAYALSGPPHLLYNEMHKQLLT